jgi:hypothetical protein
MSTDSMTTKPASERPAKPLQSDIYGLERVDLREKALPIRQGDLTRLLLAQTCLDPEERRLLGAFCPRLGSYFHQEFYQRLRDLKETYAPLDPDSDYARITGHTRSRTESLDEEFLDLFEATLDRANYRRLDNEVIKAAITAPNEIGLNYEPDFSLFEHLRVYARGYTTVDRITRNLGSKFKKRTAVLDAYQRLIVVLKFNDTTKYAKEIRSDVVYLRMFKDVPHVDMEMHLPEQGTKVKMRWLDRAQIASPIMVGLPTLMFKLFVASFAFNPALLLAPLTAGVNSFLGFQRAKQKHLSYMIRNLYYLTLANNSSVLTRLIDSAEEEEYKETLLAYFFLLKHGRSEVSSNVADLDSKIEVFLQEVTGQEINFEIADALGKLYRLGLAQRRPDGSIEALPLETAIEGLQRRWANCHQDDSHPLTSDHVKQ